MFTIEEIQKTHPNYIEVAQKADYHYRSFVGGDEYRSGGYLRKYLGEDEGPGNQYYNRLLSTALDNHCKTVIDVYRSFLFRNGPTRDLGLAGYMPEVEEFKDDVDLEGRDMDDFMKMVNDWTSVYGTTWILIDKPAFQAQTAAEEQALGLRPYAAMYSPSAVLDWKYSTDITGRRVLTMVKIVEERCTDYDVIKIWTPMEVHKVWVQKDIKNAVTSNLIVYGQGMSQGQTYEYTDIINYEITPNPLGIIPIINVVATPSLIDGVGVSDINDVADIQRSIYNKLSEMEQAIRISNHPALVKTADTKAQAGAGAVITMDSNLDAGLKPYLIQPTGATVDSIAKAIELEVDSIKRMTHLAAVQATKGSPMSGVALQTEFQLLNASLSERADLLEQIEYKIWALFFSWMGMDTPEEFEIDYPDSFDLRDQHSDLELYKKALEIVPVDAFKKEVYKRIAELVLGDEEAVMAAIENLGLDTPEVTQAIADYSALENQEKLDLLNADIAEEQQQLDL